MRKNNNSSSRGRGSYQSSSSRFPMTPGFADGDSYELHGSQLRIEEVIDDDHHRGEDNYSLHSGTDERHEILCSLVESLDTRANHYKELVVHQAI